MVKKYKEKQSQSVFQQTTLNTQPIADRDNAITNMQINANSNIQSNINQQIIGMKQVNKGIYSNIRSRIGRPLAKQGKILKYSSVDMIKNTFIKFLDNVGYKQGLVFTAKDRKKLIAKQQKLKTKEYIQQSVSWMLDIVWDEQHTWNKQQQRIKIQQTTKQYNILFQHMDGKLHEYLLEIGDIFCRQVTQQIYRFFCRLYLITLCKINTYNNNNNNESQIKQINQFVKQILQTNISNKSNYVFINGRCGKQLQIQTSDDRTEKQLNKLCLYIIKYIKQLLKVKKI